MYCESSIYENIQYGLTKDPVGSREYDVRIAYIEGMIEGMEKFGTARYTPEEVLSCWETLGYHVASRESITPYFRMLAILNARPELLVNYKKDFYTHDYHSVRRSPDKAFVWIVRPNGTHLFFLDDEKIDETIKSAFSCWGNQILFFGVYSPDDTEFYEFNTQAWTGKVNDLLKLIDEGNAKVAKLNGLT